MLQSMRDKAKSWVTFIVVGIIAFMMAITGLETLAPNPNNPEVASVNGKEITRAELAQAVDQQRRMLVQQMGEQFDPAMLDEKLLQASVLDSLVDRQLLLQSAEDEKMGVGNAQIDLLILSMPQFQQNGAFDKDRYQMMVRSYGMLPLQFRDVLRDETVLQQLRSGIVNTEFVTQKELQRLQNLEGQTRDLSWVILSAEAVRNGITPVEADIQSYYDANLSQYMTAEQVVVDYVVLDKKALAGAIDISEDDINAEYQFRAEQLKQTTGNNPHVSVILIQTGETRSFGEATARAEEVVARLNAGENFVDLAKAYSDDPMTAEKGGDLGAVASGFFGDEFDEAVADLSVGEVSKPIETDFGLQILTVTSKDAVAIPALAEMRSEIESSLKQSQVDTLYLQQARELADISFEASDLAQPAEQLGLTIITSEPFGKSGSDAGIATDPRVVSAAFSDDVLSLGANSELIELTPEQSLVLRVKEHRKPELIPLDVVKENIIAALKSEQAAKELAARSESMQGELSAGKTLKAVADGRNLEVVTSEKAGRGQAGVPAQLLQQAFKMPHPGDKVSYDVAELANGDYALIALSAIYPGEVVGDQQQLKGLGQFIASGNGQVMFEEYLSSLKQRGKVDIMLNDE